MGYCTWAGMNEANRIYHDTEWGIPVHDDRHMFEHLTLECLQCGLSWDLMLKKREVFQKQFNHTGYAHIAFSVGSKEKVDALTERLQTEGYKVVSGPRTTGDGCYESCIIAIEENQIEIKE